MSASEAILQNKEVFRRITGKKSDDIRLPAPLQENYKEAEQGNCKHMEIEHIPSTLPEPIRKRAEDMSPLYPKTETWQVSEPVFEPIDETIQAIRYPEPGQPERRDEMDSVEAFVYRLEREERLYPQSMSGTHQ